MNRLLKQCSLTLLISFTCIGFTSSVQAARYVAEEYELKAVFLYNIANFINWPEYAFENEGAPFHFCVLGTDPFAGSLETTIHDEMVKSRVAKVLHLQTLEQAEQCQILFISDSERTRIDEIATKVHQHPVLLVGDTDDFIHHGGMVKFFTQEQRVRLAINPTAVQAVNLSMNANLLRVAQIVD